jgi:hypothetical protein
MKTWIAAAALAPLCLVAAAQTSTSSSTTSTSTTTNGQTTSAGYRCGGIGEDEQRAIKAEAAQHGLLLSFATPSGAYIADVDVEISNGRGTALRAHCSGPLMLVDLAGPGSWQVTARANGQIQRKTVTPGGKPATLAFTWPAS